MIYIRCYPKAGDTFYNWIKYLRELNNGKHAVSLWLDGDKNILGFIFENEEDAVVFKLRFKNACGKN